MAGQYTLVDTSIEAKTDIPSKYTPAYDIFMNKLKVAGRHQLAPGDIILIGRQTSDKVRVGDSIKFEGVLLRAIYGTDSVQC